MPRTHKALLTEHGKALLLIHRKWTGEELTPAEFIDQLKIGGRNEGKCRMCQRHRDKLRDGIFCEECVRDSVAVT